jgi:hypothetical protein
MYSCEDRLRAVQLYIKLGKRVGLTIRQLGYPTKNALESWSREYEQRLDLPAGYIRWSNEARIKISLGGLSPAGHRRSLGIAA